MMAMHHASAGAKRRRNSWPKMRVTAASVRGLVQAMAALYGDEPGPSGDEAVALLEQRRRDDEARRDAQRCLPFGSTDR